jgi:hypothetical protein
MSKIYKALERQRREGAKQDLILIPRQKKKRKK